MSPDSQPRLPAPERRELLLAGATRLFAERGYQGTDVASIAASAGVTKVIAYRAFGSKQAIYEAALALHRDELLAALGASQIDEAPATDRIRAGLDAWFGYVETHPFAWRLLFRDTSGVPGLEERHQEMRAQARKVVSGLLVEHLGMHPSEAPATAEFIRSGIVGLALWWLENRQVSRERVTEGAVRLLTGSLPDLGS